MENFIFGIVFALIIYPLLESFSAVLISGMEVLKGQLALRVSKINKQIIDIESSQHQEQETINQIGFITSLEEEEDSNEY